LATDATGTPTSPDNIPKYNTAVDAPSGKGFNAAMDALQTALTARISKPSTPSTNDALIWNGTTWVNQALANAQIATGAAIAVAKLAAGSNGQVLTTTGGVPTWGNAGQTIFRLGAPTQILNSVTETALWTQAVAGNTIGTTGLLRVTCIFDFNNATGAGANTIIRFKFGGTTMYQFTLTNTTTGTDTWFEAIFILMNRNAANSNAVRGWTDVGTQAVTQMAAVQTIDTTASQNLVVSAQNSAAQTTSGTTLHQAIAEVI
jgi:hypothetical protein